MKSAKNTAFSKRITAIVNEIDADTAADIACDHAYISILAVMTGRAGGAVACDKSAASFEKATRNIREYGFGGKIETRLADGLAGLREHEADTLVIGGIGGRLCSDILARDTAKTKSFAKLVLQPQSETYLVRKFLHRAGLKIVNETMVCDGGMFYTVLTAENGTDESYTDCDYIFGKILIRKRHPALLEFVSTELRKIDEIRKSLPSGKKTDTLDEREFFLKETLTCLK